MQPAPETIATPKVVRLAAGTTVVEFVRDGDRWRHEVRTLFGRTWRSIEGVADTCADPRWPQSPVVTEVSLEEVAGKTVILGVGLAGRSHFSLCVTIFSNCADTLLFEAACRINSEPAWLGSTYHADDGSPARIEPERPFSVPPSTVCWSYTCGPDGPRAVPPATGRSAER